jgi:hypothetical protein
MGKEMMSTAVVVLARSLTAMPGLYRQCFQVLVQSLQLDQVSNNQVLGQDFHAHGTSGMLMMKKVSFLLLRRGVILKPTCVFALTDHLHLKQISGSTEDFGTVMLSMLKEEMCFPLLQ